jgi:hypothetical protein
MATVGGAADSWLSTHSVGTNPRCWYTKTNGDRIGHRQPANYDRSFDRMTFRALDKDKASHSPLKLALPRLAYPDFYTKGSHSPLHAALELCSRK